MTDRDTGTSFLWSQPETDFWMNFEARVLLYTIFKCMVEECECFGFV